MTPRQKAAMEETERMLREWTPSPCNGQPGPDPRHEWQSASARQDRCYRCQRVRRAP